MGKSCSHGVHKSWMRRERSEANPLPSHTGTTLDAKWSLPVMGELPATENYGGDGLKKGSTDFLVKMRT